MPEGDTVHTIARYLREALVGQRLSDGRIAHAPGFVLRDRQVTAINANGKHLCIELDAREQIRVHLGMTGSWHRYTLGERWKKPAHRASLLIQREDQQYVCFSAREVEVMRVGSIAERRLQAHLGPDLSVPAPLDTALIEARARSLLGADVPLAEVLLDQRVAAGIGNVYKSELLFIARLSPFRALGRTDSDTLRALYDRARQVLPRNIGGAPRTTREVADAAGRLWVYRRADRPCHVCRTPIRYVRAGRQHRSTYWCPACQPSETD
ncbi:MAG: formamidopyrimidine DNA glycosylase [Gammaproteobacteria bacterium]|nr:formamidopyrimidine DNA glycosylase [Gammaproteobacteria bacterium]